MLEPDYIGDAGDLVGSVYSEIELEMLQYLANLLLDQDIDELGQRGLTAVYLLAQTHAPDLMGIIDSHKGEASEAVAKTVEDAMLKTDKADVSAIGTEAAAAATATLPRQVELTVRGIQAILDRDNVDMANGALNLWNRVVAQAVTKVNTGVATTERALHEAVRTMMQEGISTITYRNSETGQQTVTNNIDVAVRRHVRTQILQDGMRRTLDICRDSGIDFVEVSSHGGARPSHARWQGQVYSLRGDVEVDGVRYKDFYRETDYGSVTGLGGVNCRHSFGPWIPGTPRSYEQDPEHPSGLPNDEVYEMSQEQRRREREIRKTKRELAGAQIIADRDGSMQNIAEVERLKRKLSNQQKAMRDYINTCNSKGKADVLQRSPRREWAGDMPRIRKSDAANRTIKDFMDSKSVKNTLKNSGVSKSAARKALIAELKARDIDSRSFSFLSKTNQNKILKNAINRLNGTNKASKGKHADLLSGVVRGKPMTFKQANGGKVNPRYGEPGSFMNCQTCVVAFEARLRGYDVTAKTYDKNSPMKDLAQNTNLAWIDPATGKPPLPFNSQDALTPKKFLKFLEDNIEQDARYTLRFANSPSGDGHIVCLDRTEQGELRIYDPQIGKVYTGRNMRNYIRQFTFRTTYQGLKITYPPDILRVDNLELNKSFLDGLLE